MENTASYEDMQECIAECLDCYSVCTQTAMNQCLEEGGDHVRPDHFRLMINCAEICRTAADFMLSSSSLHTEVCAVCADVCDACAESCERVGGMEECAEACRSCAESCRQMAGAVELGTRASAQPASESQPTAGM